MYAAQRHTQTRAINRQNNPTQRCAVTQQPQRNAVPRRTRNNTKPQSQYCGTTPCSLRSRQRRRADNEHPRRAFHVARMTQPRCFTFSHVQRALPRTCRLAPRSPLPSHRKHARADTHAATSPTHHNGTSASWRMSPKTAHTYNPRTPHRTLTRSVQPHTSCTPARRPTQPRRLRTA